MLRRNDACRLEEPLSDEFGIAIWPIFELRPDRGTRSEPVARPLRPLEARRLHAFSPSTARGNVAGHCEPYSSHSAIARAAGGRRIQPTILPHSLSKCRCLMRQCKSYSYDGIFLHICKKKKHA